MSKMELLCRFSGINVSKLSKQEVALLEAELFIKICEEVKEFFKSQYWDYFRLVKFSIKEGESMLDANFVRLIIQDILSTEEYTSQGIAYYTNTPEDIIQEVIDGRNVKPSADLLRKSIDLHRSVRRELYNMIIKKIISNYETVIL